jgi:ADP-ribosylglycohydrolase
MLGAICGDVIGSVHERRGTKETSFNLFDQAMRFTDDTVLTVATAEAILTGEDYGAAYHRYARRYPHAGYGSAFRAWLRSDNPRPYGSWGNGSAMRVSPVGWMAASESQALEEAARSAAPTHDHAEGVKGAQAVALAVYLARTGTEKEGIRRRVSEQTGYDLSRSVEAIRPAYRFDVSSAGSVPESIVAFLDAGDFEDAVRLAVSLGGDADTQAAIAGGIAEAYWGGVPASIEARVRRVLPQSFVTVIEAFQRRFPRSREGIGL